MYKKKKSITNEKLNKKFENNFDLVNYAISLAENMINTGREPIESDSQNRAMFILDEIDRGEDRFYEKSKIESSDDKFVVKAHEVNEEIQEKLIYEQEVATSFSIDEEE